MPSKTQHPARREPAQLAPRASTVQVARPEDKGDRPQRAVPAFLRGHVMKEAPGLTPTVDWQPIRQMPDQYIVGFFVQTREDVGPNHSMLYDLADWKSGELIGVWGGTVLDDKMAKLGPQKGDLLLIQYLGDLVGKPGQNPPRDFRVAIVAVPQGSGESPASY
jgi:hypothetical protein